MCCPPINQQTRNVDFILRQYDAELMTQMCEAQRPQEVEIKPSPLCWPNLLAGGFLFGLVVGVAYLFWTRV